MSPTPALVNQDYVVSATGLRRELDVVLRITDASGARKVAAKTDLDGKVSTTTRSTAVGAGSVVVEGPNRKGVVVDLVSCAFEVTTAPVCGDNKCNGAETCSTCPGDCGTCPPPSTCEPAATTLPDGRHNAGKDCQGCHDGSNAVAFTVAGTVYNNLAGSAAVSGATVVVTDASGKTLKLITASNGNFYTRDALRFPLKVLASKCPDTKDMVASVSEGGCNGCHNSGNRMHLP